MGDDIDESKRTMLNFNSLYCSLHFHLFLKLFIMKYFKNKVKLYLVT